MPYIRPLPSLLANLFNYLKLKKRRLATDTRILEALKLAMGLLKEKFNLRKRASQKFPLEISYLYIRSFINKYKNKILITSKILICCSCSGFTTIEDIYKINN